MNNVSTDKLVQDMRAIVFDAEELLKATASQTGERVEKVRSKVEDSLKTARARLQQAGAGIDAQAREAIREVDEQVRNNPWTTAGIAAGIGLLIGLLVGRR